MPADAALAARGKKLFMQKSCNACHSMDSKMTGPALGPVPRERTAAWMMSMILHPADMTKSDPIARQLLQQFKVQMVPPVPVNAEEARALVEYIKSGGK